MEFLYGLQAHGIKLGLDAIRALLARLGNPQAHFVSLHIGGTNGKGSTAAIAASILQAAGYRVGLYTSPHLIDFRERIRINGELISEDRIVQLTEHLRETLDQTLHPTFFEFTTAMALEHFAESNVEIAVVEVGMGGRYDATNVLAPLVSAITNVALDHQEYLGHTVGAIAFEKAGIVKIGVPVVGGRLSAEAAEVIRQIAAERAAPIYELDSAFRASGDTIEGFRYDGIRASYTGLTCPLAGSHQLDNAACALALLELGAARGLRLSEDAIRSGLRHVRWEGRLEVVERHPTLVLDGAHNPAAGMIVRDYLVAQRRMGNASRIILVLGMMRDKDREGFMRELLPLVDEVVLTQASHPRAATVQELRASLGEQTASAHAVPVPADALALARRLATPEDLICVTGSLMLVGDVKAALQGCELSPIRG